MKTEITKEKSHVMEKREDFRKDTACSSLDETHQGIGLWSHTGALVTTGKPHEGWSQQRPQETNMLCDVQYKHTPSKDLDENCVFFFLCQFKCISRNNCYCQKRTNISRTTKL